MISQKKNEGCKIIGEYVKIVEVKKGILNTLKIILKESVRRLYREKLDRCFRENKIKVIWGDKSQSLIIK